MAISWELTGGSGGGGGGVSLAGDLGNVAATPWVMNLSHVTNGSLPAAGIAAVNPSSLTGSGTVPLAGLSGITTTQLSATAGIVAGQIASVNPSALTGTGTVPLAGLSGITTAQLSATAGIVVAQLSSGAAANNAVATANGSGGVTWQAVAGSGTVTSVGLTAPADLTVTGSPVTGSGTLAISRNTQTANTFLSGPTSGGALAPTYRVLVAADVPAVNPSALTGSGTVPLAGLAGITTTQLSATAGIVAGQIASVNPSVLTGSGTVPLAAIAGLTSTQVSATGGIAVIQESVNTVGASGASQTIPDVPTDTINYITLTAACTLTFPTAVAGKSFVLVAVQDGTGSRLITWPGSIKWVGGTAPTLTTTASKADAISFVCADGTNWIGFVMGQNI